MIKTIHRQPSFRAWTVTEVEEIYAKISELGSDWSQRQSVDSPDGTEIVTFTWPTLEAAQGWCEYLKLDKLVISTEIITE